jgi:hypothetical protein
MTDTPRTDKASHLCYPWTLPTDHEALSKFRLLANEMARLELELAETKRLLADASKDAERYQVLRKKFWGIIVNFRLIQETGLIKEVRGVVELDEAIDAIKELK